MWCSDGFDTLKAEQENEHIKTENNDGPKVVAQIENHYTDDVAHWDLRANDQKLNSFFFQVSEKPEQKISSDYNNILSTEDQHCMRLYTSITC